MRLRHIVSVVAILGALVVAWQFIAQADIPLLQPAGPIAAGEKHVMFLVVAFASIVVIPVFIMLFLFAWAFREGSGHAERSWLPDLERYGSYPELIWWAIPGIIMIILSVVSWQTSHSLDPYEPLSGTGAPLEIQVVALDWKWLFIYPAEGIATLDQLEIPVGRPVHFTLTADAPMNSLWIPQLGGQVMVMPGMSSQLWLRADREGVFDGYSANLSGEGFARMHFKTTAIPASDFDAWVAGVRAGSAALTPERYRQLREPGVSASPLTFAPVFDGLFGGVVASFMMPGMAAQEAIPDGMHDIDLATTSMADMPM